MLERINGPSWTPSRGNFLETAARTKLVTAAWIQTTTVRVCSINRDPQHARHAPQGHGKEGVDGSSPSEGSRRESRILREEQELLKAAAFFVKRTRPGSGVRFVGAEKATTPWQRCAEHCGCRGRATIACRRCAGRGCDTRCAVSERPGG